MNKYISLVLVYSCIYAMQRGDEDLVFLSGDAGSDYYSKEAELACIKRQERELEALFLEQKKENKTNKRTRTYSK